MIQLLFAAGTGVWATATTCLSRRTASELGLGGAGFRSLIWAIPGAAAVSGVMMLGAWWAGTLHELTGAHSPPWHAALYAVWALIQEFLLLSFISVRFCSVLSRRSRAIAASALLFCLAHLPNPILMGTTFLLALAVLPLFTRHRNLYPLAIAHAMLGLAVAVSVPTELTHSMKVGIAYWR